MKASLRSAHSFQSSSLLPFRDLGFNFIINCSLILFSDVSQHLFCLIDDAKVRQFSAPNKFFANNYPRYMRQGCECATDGRHGLESCRSSGNTWGLERCVIAHCSSDPMCSSNIYNSWHQGHRRVRQRQVEQNAQCLAGYDLFHAKQPINRARPCTTTSSSPMFIGAEYKKWSSQSR